MRPFRGLIIEESSFFRPGMSKVCRGLEVEHKKEQLLCRPSLGVIE